MGFPKRSLTPDKLSSRIAADQMDLLATVDEEEALRNIQTQGENLIDGTVGEIERDEL